MKVFVAHWDDLVACLPIGSDLASQGKRRDLFNIIDGSDGKGILSQTKTIRALYRALPPITGITDARPFLSRAFRTIVKVIAPVARIGTDNLDRNQFRALLIYIWYYIKIWELLLQSETEVKGHVTLLEFEAALAWLQESGFNEAKVWEQDPGVAFSRLSGGSRVLPVEEFIDRCLSSGLHDLCHEGDEKEREFAIRMLERTHPHLLADGPPKKFLGLTFIGSSLPVPPPGQKRPPPGPVPETLVKPNAFNRWSSQYTCDYEAPSRLASKPQSTSVTAAPSRAGHGHGTYALQRASSVPDAQRTLSGLDREELRAKLEKHLEMNTTAHMRKLLTVAGGMVTDSSSKRPASRGRPTKAPMDK